MLFVRHPSPTVGVLVPPDPRHAVADLGEYIREQRRQAELSVRKLADLAGVSNPYLSQIERGLKRPSAEILQQIARALEVSAESLYVRAGILDEEPEADLIAAIRAQDDLTHDQKQVLIQVYESFLAQNEM
ncbi:MAG TPA: transcriptional regulator [Acidimicrobiaceae bacterium]|nr:transcriptional regulator [Acidimicrobiaceae bacterium]HAI64764.1 transcriptional regulator [Acidimicrobiaceae bacterium]HCH81195.1 transcriptional regulator [Acidimicrobiaceae bacterium]|tara:strand:- start:70 stop:462 length:393 start_codon:yes stop_codon:yes gene_type:complete